MMKQPEDNNTSGPVFLDSPEVQEEIAQKAREYFQGRGGHGDLPEAEDWDRAREVVRNSLIARQTG